MRNLFRWIWDGEDVGKRLAWVCIAAAAYVTGAGWRPDEPVWIAGGVGVMLTATMQRPKEVQP